MSNLNNRDKILKENGIENRVTGRVKNAGFIASIVMLSCAVIILGSLLTLQLVSPRDENMINAVEERNFYDLVSYVDNIDVNLSKLSVSGSDKQKQKILGEVANESGLAENSLSEMSMTDENKFYTCKFINQVGDFAKYLQNKLIDGEKLSEEDLQTLQTMQEINLSLKNSLSSLASLVDEDFEFKSIYENKGDNLIIGGFTELESNAVDYPKMIYDGPFSDALKLNESKYLVNFEEIDIESAKSILKDYLSSYNITKLEEGTQTENAEFDCYNFTGELDGVEFFAQITKRGGKLAMFNYYKNCTQTNYDEESCETVAKEFLNKLGYTNLEEVWRTIDGHTLSISFVGKSDGVVCYNDMIKVNVCRERGIVYGINAVSYLLNKTQRTFSNPTLTIQEAESYLNGKLEVESAKLAIIPKGEGNEILCYEFKGSYNGETYFVYVDADSGEERDIFKVVTTDDGVLLL